MNLDELLNAGMLNEINISTLSFVYALLSSTFSGLVLRSLYIRYGRSMNNREYFGNVFVLLGLTTCSVIVIVKYSLALSLGLVGALSIVRFRAAIKEPEELVFLFLVIALGISFGANQYSIGFILLIASSLIIIFSNKLIWSKTGLDQTGIIIIISGDRKIIEHSFETDLKYLIDQTLWAIIKEINFENKNGRVVIKCSSSSDASGFIDKISEYCRKKDLNFNLIADVNVPI
jgi:hypothetical protein